MTSYGDMVSTGLYISLLPDNIKLLPESISASTSVYRIWQYIVAGKSIKRVFRKKKIQTKRRRQTCCLMNKKTWINVMNE